ncbi:FliM/FliN family flagellar motor switch protein [Vibrio parahaemolyticus]|uniref:FliM/FliN family flagellar motor switch protein n=1 Tax=Vibrio parahaemolyticus TaxID=670 RepID=UPI0003592631|nr:FliM/FliN family flagellar motor switch protein [Vibrio parahaemolyticus]AGQ92648.1 flagellar motor switch protein FliM [Vibrio parahaemolyticus O1:Kuk str. FDA_R31]EHK0043865.1 FliM/FliN family flagellar motor switch protein [Vibrio parahaemolyticus]EHR6401613.1 FliM/FliN family flagellar motor switch protein [Vibrio parahaemolyticus]EIU7879752.1 FliM/FliN family flagellar motor switch protein [Vibrio parahaemolyticus]EJB0393928.1 FliM/FliN family flagellar motor switch protein [Vibrio par
METRVSESISDIKTLDVELLGKPIHIIRDKLENLISESCSSLTNELQNWLSTNKVEASLTSVDLHRFSPAMMDKDQTSTHKHQEGGMVFVHGDTQTLVKLADHFYGANTERSVATLTASDLRLQERISRIIIGWLAPQDMWEACEYEAPRGIGLCVQLNITFEGYQGSMYLKLDTHLIQTLIEQLELQSGMDLYEPFCRSLESTPVRLNVVLSKKTMALSDVVSLKPDDIMPIELLNTVPVSIGNQPLFTGRIAEQDGQLVLIFNPDKETQR